MKWKEHPMGGIFDGTSEKHVIRTREHKSGFWVLFVSDDDGGSFKPVVDVNRQPLLCLSEHHAKDTAEELFGGEVAA